MLAAIAAVVVSIVFALGELASAAFPSPHTGMNANPIGDGSAAVCDGSP